MADFRLPKWQLALKISKNFNKWLLQGRGSWLRRWVWFGKDQKVPENKMYQRESIVGREGGCAEALRLERAPCAQGAEGGWFWQGPNGVGKEASRWAGGSLSDPGTKSGFYSKATGSLWRVVSSRMSGSDLHFFFLNIIGLFCERPARGQLGGSDGCSGERQWCWGRCGRRGRPGNGWIQVEP